MATQYYNEMNTIDLVNSPQWVDSFNFSQEFNHEPTEEELLELIHIFKKGYKETMIKDKLTSIEKDFV